MILKFVIWLVKTMSKLLHAKAKDDFTVLLEFERGDKIVFNMGELVKTIPYFWLNGTEFKNMKFDEKSIYWEPPVGEKQRLIPARFGVDEILFTIRD